MPDPYYLISYAVNNDVTVISGSSNAESWILDCNGSEKKIHLLNVL
jgi:hypothetical protein